ATSNGITVHGNRVLFRSAASNLVTPAPPPGTINSYIHDIDTGQTILVNTAADGTLGDELSNLPLGTLAPVSIGGSALTPDGNYLVFGSVSSNLVSSDTNNLNDVFKKQLPASLATPAISINDVTLTEGNTATKT